MARQEDLEGGDEAEGIGAREERIGDLQARGDGARLIVERADVPAVHRAGFGARQAARLRQRRALE